MTFNRNLTATFGRIESGGSLRSYPFPSLAPYAALVTLRKDQRDARLAEVPGASHPWRKVQVTL